MKFYNKKKQYIKGKEESNTYAKKIMIISIILVCVLIVTLIICTGFALFNINSDKVINGISIKEIEIGGLTIQEAKLKINEKIQEKLDADIIFESNDFEYSIKLSQIETSYDVEKAVQSAYSIGRDGNIFSNNFNIINAMTKKKQIDLEYTYNEKLLDDILLDIAAKIPNAVIEPSYYIEDNKLIINKGKNGNSIDKEKTKNKIIDIIQQNNNDNSIEIQIDVIEIEPENIDIEKIHNEVYKEPKNAYYTKDPFEVFTHENGIDFDIDAAKEIINNEDKEEYEISLKITEPEITISKIGTEAFPDLLSTFSTKYDVSNKPRTNNLILAMQKLDGVVVSPGETFSYNKTLGKRTAEAGYKEANGFAGGKVVPMLAGGICQISSTLYDAVVYANLEIVERHNHMFLAGYVGAGRDATVVYGSCDFQFKNTRKYPIMIKTSIGSGIAKISIFGIKEEVEYEVEISTKILSYIPFSVTYESDSSLAVGQERTTQNGMNGCKSITYKILKLNGQQVSSEVLSTDTYDAMNKIVKRGTKQIAQETYIEPQVTEEPMQEPAQEPTVEQVQQAQETSTPHENSTEEINNNGI